MEGELMGTVFKKQTKQPLRLNMPNRVADYFGLIVGPASKLKRKGK